MAYSLNDFFHDQPVSRTLYDQLSRMIEDLGSSTIAITKSQVAFRRKRPFAWAWMPGQYLKGRETAPLVLSLAFRHFDPSPRWKQVVEPARGRFLHHLELYTPADLDEEVRNWLRMAWDLAG